MNGRSPINISVTVILVIVLIYLVYINHLQDIIDVKNLNNIKCHKEMALPRINRCDKLVIESVIEDYWKKRSMNKSNVSRIINNIRVGVMRGFISGVIIGNSFESITVGALVFGLVSGISTAHNLSQKTSLFMLKNKPT
jgi:hypothetical protein